MSVVWDIQKPKSTKILVLTEKKDMFSPTLAYDI